MIYRDRREAGRELARLLEKYRGWPGLLVLGLPRGGVPVAYEVAHALDASLDIFVVRKLGVPGHEELAMGAVASGGARVLNAGIIDALGISDEAIERVATRERRELSRRERLYRGERPPPDVRGKTVILVDDGLATGSTMRAAAEALRTTGAGRIVAAVPIGATSTCAEFTDEVDDVVCARTPDPFYAVGVWYADFSQTSDDEVRSILERARREHERAPAAPELSSRGAVMYRAGPKP
jgi:predicted phosphoribosyltransferase